MSRIDPTVKKETGYIAGWVLLLSAVMELVFLLTGHMDYTVPLGNLLGGGAAILNFFLMGWTIQRAVGLDEKAAAAKLKLSQTAADADAGGAFAVWALRWTASTPWR